MGANDWIRDHITIDRDHFTIVWYAKSSVCWEFLTALAFNTYMRCSKESRELQCSATRKDESLLRMQSTRFTFYLRDKFVDRGRVCGAFNYWSLYWTQLRGSTGRGRSIFLFEFYVFNIAKKLTDVSSFLISGIFRGGAEVLVRCKLALSEGVHMQITVRSTDPSVAEMITLAIA